MKSSQKHASSPYDAGRQTTDFKTTLGNYKSQIDQSITVYSQKAAHSVLKNYGAHSRVALDAYLSILGRGGKRVRGALCMVGYEMQGGTDMAMVIEAARAIEMVHAYILIIDDINDRSLVRRGDATAHIMLREYHQKQGYADDSAHFGESIAMNAALVGNHAANIAFHELMIEDDLKLKVLASMNYAMIVTGHGQINDMFNEVVGEVDERAVDNVLEWKTAHYTFLNPLTLGMVLAGADCAATDAIRDYSLAAGRVFQITDDILGTFGEAFESGKSPLDDMREGKRTILTTYALKHAPKVDSYFLLEQLGNRDLTQAAYERCKTIIQECGALQHAQTKAAEYATEAKRVLLPAAKAQGWREDKVQFLTSLVDYLLTRQS